MARCSHCDMRRKLDEDGLCKRCRTELAESFEGAMCSRCELDLTPDGLCPNDRCAYHHGYQDEVVADGSWPSEEERAYIEQIRERGRRGS